MNTTTKRKVRGDAKLEQLDARQREMLRYWFEENCTYAEITGLVEQEFGLTVGKSAVGVYWRRHIRPERQDDEAEIVAAVTTRPGADFDAATLQHVRTLAWTTLAQPEPEVDQGLKLMGAVFKAERLALARERNAIAVERLALAERRVVLKEEAAGKRPRTESKKKTEVARELRESARIPRQDGEPRNTRKDTKGAEESAEVAGRGEHAEGAAKALSGEGRSEGAEGGNVEEREIGKVTVDGSEVKNAEPNLPRFPGYSGLERDQELAEEARELRELARIPRQDEEPRNTQKDTKGAEESAEVVGGDGHAEVAAKARSCEGRSEGTAEENVSVRTAEEVAPLLVDDEVKTDGVAGGVSHVRASGGLNSGRLGETPLPSEPPVRAFTMVQLSMPSQEELMRRNERRLAQKLREAKAPREQW